jgi:hypothetical protein
MEKQKIFKIEALIKSDAELDKTHIFNEIRALEGIITLSVHTNDYLIRRSTDEYEYSLLSIKYTSPNQPIERIKDIIKNSKTTSKIHGLFQFIPRIKTISQVGTI